MKLARMPDGRPEIFCTLQGEGRNCGRPSIFIRASLCNLSCQWCDTAYTWNWEDTNFEHESGLKYRREYQIVDYSISDIIAFVEDFPCRNFVFTGGEPLLQEKAWVELMTEVSRTNGDASFEIETNGTLFPKEDFLTRIHQINVSPKLSNSGCNKDARYKPEVLQKLADTGKADFKFVVGANKDWKDLSSLLNEVSIPKDRIFLMPKANSPEELDRNQSIVAELAQQQGFRYSDRLHLRLYGAKRGV